MNAQTLTPTRKNVIHIDSPSAELSPLRASPLKVGAAALLDDLKAKTTEKTPNQPLHFKQIASFLGWVIAAIITDTAFAIVQSLKCTLLLLCELPKPWIDSLRALLPLWLTAFSVFPLVAAACASKIVSEIADRVQVLVSRLSPSWIGPLVSRAFQPLASLYHSVVVPSSAVPSAPSSTTSFPWATRKMERLFDGTESPQKVVAWADLKIPEQSLLD